jgi:hypothetical protein
MNGERLPGNRSPREGEARGFISIQFVFHSPSEQAAPAGRQAEGSAIPFRPAD